MSRTNAHLENTAPRIVFGQKTTFVDDGKCWMHIGKVKIQKKILNVNRR
jgi:hypothetical protein